MFLASSIITGLIRILFHARACGKFVVGLYIYFRLQAAIFDFSLSPTHVIVYISQVVLLDIETIGIAVGILMLSRIKAEIYVISYPLPVTGRHL